MVNDILDVEYRDETAFWKLLQQGYLMVGTESGPFDEHRAHMKGVSASQLVARHLNIHERYELQDLLIYSNQTDSSGDKVSWLDPARTDIRHAVKQLMPASNIKRFWRLLNFQLMVHELTQEEADAKTEEFISSIFRDMNNFVDDKLAYNSEVGHVLAKTTFVKMDKMGDVEGMKGYPVLAVVEDDSPYSLQVILDQRRLNPNIGLVLLVKSTGNFCLLAPHRGMKPHVINAVKALRAHVSYQRGKVIPWKESKYLLGVNGAIPEAPELYYDEVKSFGLYNGSSTQPDMPGLLGKSGLMTLPTLIKMITNSVQTNYWPEHVANKCSSGRSCAVIEDRSTKCPLFPFHLERCAANRREQYRLKGEGRNTPPPMTVVKDDSPQQDDQRMAG
jgi:hypothetical protein